MLTLNIHAYLAIALLLSLLSSKFMKKLNLPNVTGYLVFGLLAGPYCLNVITKETTDLLSIVPEMALGFIAFSIGSEFKLSFLKRTGKAPIIIAILEGVSASLFVTLILILTGHDPAFSLVLGAIAAATAPAATLMVVRQYNARGPVTSTLLPVVALDDVVAIVVFGIAVAAAKAINAPGGASIASAVLGPIREIGGALLLGSVLGIVLKLLTDLFSENGMRLTAAAAMVLLATGLSLLVGASSLLTCMAMSALFANFSKDSGRVFEEVDRFTPPIFMLFFFVSGAHLNINILPSVGLIGLLYITFRVLGKLVGCQVGASLANAEPVIKKYLGWTLVPQAGVAIGLATVSMSAVPQYGPQIQTVVLCATLVYELIGPVITKLTLERAGEIASARPYDSAVPRRLTSPTLEKAHEIN